MVQEAKSPVKNFVRQRCAEVFNSGVNGLMDAEEHLFLHQQFLLSYVKLNDDGLNRNRNILIARLVPIVAQ
jgi:hypothetical protein